MTSELLQRALDNAENAQRLSDRIKALSDRIKADEKGSVVIEGRCEDVTPQTLKPFTVVAFDEESGQICSHHALAPTSSKALFDVAQDNPLLSFVAVMNGHLMEGEGITFAGESIVDAETIISQPEVFNLIEDSVLTPSIGLFSSEVVNTIQAGAITFNCPHCHELIDVSGDPRGTNQTCPECGLGFTVSANADITLD